MGITNMSEDTNESGSRVSNGKPYVTDITCVNYQRQIVHTSNAKEDITSLIFVSVSFRLSDGTTMDVLIGHDGLELACSPSKGFSECITWDAIHAAIKHRIPGDALILQPSD